MPDLISRVQFSSILAKKAGIILCKASPDPILKALSRFGQTDLVWKQADVQESSGPLLAERKRPATSFHFQTQLCSSTDSLDRDCTKPVCVRVTGPTSGQCFCADSDRTRIRSSTFTAILRKWGGRQKVESELDS